MLALRRRPAPALAPDPAPPAPSRPPALPALPALPAPTVAERVVARAAGVLAGRHSRRRFLARTAVVGSALAVNPVGFVLKPGSAYAALCGTCTDGWTAFCCTVNSGRNSCPPDTFVAGWWKADNAAYCCGQARYIIDCNATCPTRCACRCADDGCDGRRACCAQFRYGQCNQQIACYGPVACRVALCIPPWVYDGACSTHTLVDNRTSQHGAPCLRDECDSPVIRKFYALGGPDGLLGVIHQSERDAPGGGRFAVFDRGRIYHSPATGAREVHGSILDVWLAAGATTGAYRFPTADQRATADGRAQVSTFQGGAVYAWSGGTHGVPDPYWAVYEDYGGHQANGALGLPTAASQRTADQRSLFIAFERGRIYRRGSIVAEIHGASFAKHEALGGPDGPLGHVQTSVLAQPDGRGRVSHFEHGGAVYYTAQTGAAAAWGPLHDAYLAYGGPASDAGYPTGDRQEVGDGRGTTLPTETAQVWATPDRGAHLVPAGLLAPYLAQGGPGGALGYPVAAATAIGGGQFRQQFEHGDLVVDSPHVPFVKATYADFLDRAPTPGEIDARVVALQSGALTRAALARELAGSSEYVSALVSRLYLDTLGRPGDAPGTAYWVDEIRSGRRSPTRVAAAFYSSREYYDGIGGGTDRSWVADLYPKLLERAATGPDLDYWAGEVGAGGRGRVALRLYQSAESRGTRVDRLYRALLGRPAEPAGRAYWAERVLTGGDIALAVNLAALQEYRDRAADRFP